MKQDYQSIVEYPEKNRAVARILWVYIACVTLIEALDCYLLYLDAQNPLQHYFVFQNAFFAVAAYCVIGAAASVFCRVYNEKKPMHTSYACMLSVLIITNITVVMHSDTHVIFATYIIPVIISLVYNNRRMMLMSGVATMVTCLAVMLLYLPLQDAGQLRSEVLHAVIILAVIAISFLAGLRILDTYSGLMNKMVDQTIKKVTLERENMQDPLTKLYNHAVFYDYLDLAILSYKESRIDFCIFVMDIDNFKSVNDTFGHAFGDQVILKLVDAINKNVTADDIPFRYGGEEFTVISFRSADDAFALSEKIREDFSATVYEDNPDCRFTVSIGLSHFSDSFVGKREYFSSADRALYTAKRTGKNKTVIATYNPDDDGYLI